MEGTRYTQRLLVDIDCLFDTTVDIKKGDAKTI